MKARDFRLAKLALWGLVLCTGALAVIGVLSLFDGGASARGFIITAFAGMVFCSLCVSQVAAACAQMLDKSQPWARGLAFLCAAITGLASVAGVFLGDAVLRGHPPAMPPVELMVVGGFVLSFVKQAMSFVITACEGKELVRVAGADDVLRVKDDRIAELERRLREAEKASQAKPQAPAPARPADRAKAARTLARELKNQRPSNNAPRGEPQPIERLEPEARDVSIAEIETACQAIMQRRTEDDQPMVPSLRLVAGQLNVPRSRVDKALIGANTKLAAVVERLAA